MTVSGPGHPASDDPLASERLAMVGQLVVAQFDLETAIAALRRSGGDAVTAQTQLQNITQLRQQIGTVSPTALAALRSEIVAAVAQSQNAVQDALTAASGAGAAEGATLANLASRAQSQATAFMRDLRQYDGSLQFENDAERDAYRQREEDRRKQHDAGIAEGGPEGALKASGAAYGQAVDLAVHGGSADPALLRRVDELAASTAALRAGMIRDGKDVSKFDENMGNDLRAIMRSKGKSDAEIDALLAAHPDNPMDAMKAFVQQDHASFTGRELDSIKAKVERGIDTATASTEHVVESRLPSPANLTAMADVVAKLRASGVTDAAKVADAAPAHGVTLQNVSAPVPGVAHP
ncbi:hypothetical protein [Sphingobium sp. MK2]|uniref:hypothetical protein n=1 Tax=Sphingobium sp. MK2 TaxID=3116540 RepID=UPI0032E3595F